MPAKLDAVWNENFRCFCGYVQRHGGLPSSGCMDVSTTGTGIFYWYRNQKNFARKGTLPADRLTAMNSFLGVGWENRVERAGKKSVDDYPAIPDKGRNYSISSMYRVGMLTDKEYMKLYQTGIHYIDDYLKSIPEGSKHPYGVVTDAKLYTLIKKDFGLPEICYVRMYCVGVSRCLQEIFKKKLRVDIYGIQHMPENYKKLTIATMPANQSSVFMAWLSSDDFVALNYDSNGFNGVAKRFGMYSGDVARICRKAIMLMIPEKDLFTYDKNYQLKNPADVSNRIEHLITDTRVQRCLRASGIETVQQLQEILRGVDNPESLLDTMSAYYRKNNNYYSLRHFGPSSARKLFEVMKSNNLL